MIELLKRLWQTRRAAAPAGVTSTPTLSRVSAPAVAPIPPLYFLDVDTTGRLFLRFAHATSSVHASSIREHGLRPLINLRAALLEYLAKLFPGENAEDLLSMIETDSDQRRSGLVTRRLEDEAAGRATLSLLPLGMNNYLEEAASNALRDGGEVYRAAREAVNSLCGVNAPPPYPDAIAKVFVVRHYLEGKPPDLQLIGNESHGVSLGLAIQTDFQSEHWCSYGTQQELEVHTPYQPKDIDGEFTLTEYMKLRTARVSPAAIEAATALFAAE